MASIAVLNFGKSVDAGTYAEMAFHKTNMPKNVDMDFIEGLGMETAAALWQAIDGSNLIVGSGSALDVGKPINELADHNKRELTPNLQNGPVKVITDVLRFFILKTLEGVPEIAEKHVLLNCFSAQAFAFALTLVAYMHKKRTAQKRIQDITDLGKEYPLEQLIEEDHYQFPIVQMETSQVGMFTPDHVDHSQWPLHGLEGQPLFYIHNQGIDHEVMVEALKVLEGFARISASREREVTNKRGKVKVVDALLFGKGKKKRGAAFQPHTDYGKPSNFAEVVRNLQNKGKDVNNIFYPGPGGIDSNGRKRSMAELLEYLSKQEDPAGRLIMQRMVDAAFL